jgi:PPK2 family polyphosphate:nucleotide phosphotransferase
LAVSRIDDMRVKPGRKFSLGDHDPADRLGWKTKQDALAASEHLEERLRELVAKLAATRAKAALLVLQGLDCAGKDGTTRAAFSQISPTFLRVAAFKAPTAAELAHDFLWRVHAVLPERGQVGVFNRSHYEDVLVVRVDSLVPKAVWSRRYDAINAFERHLVDEGTVIVKCMLNLSRDEQAVRLRERLADPTKNWKFSADDLAKRKQWDDYVEAYRVMLEKTSTAWAPWYVVPADRNSVRNAAVTELLVDALDRLGMEWPALDPAVKALTVE